jgi:hypothetical protein
MGKVHGAQNTKNHTVFERKMLIHSLKGVDAYPEDKQRLYYKIKYLDRTLLAWSPLGIYGHIVGKGPAPTSEFVDGLNFVRVMEDRVVHNFSYLNHCSFKLSVNCADFDRNL